MAKSAYYVDFLNKYGCAYSERLHISAKKRKAPATKKPGPAYRQEEKLKQRWLTHLAPDLELRGSGHPDASAWVNFNVLRVGLLELGELILPVLWDPPFMQPRLLHVSIAQLGAVEGVTSRI